MPPNPGLLKLQQELEAEKQARERAEQGLRSREEALAVLTARVDEAQSGAKLANEEAAAREATLTKALEVERAQAAHATALLDETKAKLEAHRDSLSKVATHRDVLVAENIDLKKTCAKAQVQTQASNAASDKMSKEGAALRAGIEQMRADHAQELERYRGSVAEVQVLQEKLQALENNYSSLKAQHARLSAGAEPEPMKAGTSADAGVWIDAGGLKELSRRLPRTENNQPIFDILGLKR